jgi:putative MFS transporter
MPPHTPPAVSLNLALPRHIESRKAPPSPERIIAAIEESPMTRRHWYFLIALLGALAFDSMKPATIGFVMPGMKEMFGLSPQTASYLGVSGLTGTFLGSLVWGYLGDRIGRKPGLLLTVTIFIVASFCGAAMEYWQSIVACFVMGFGVGGEVPLVFALAAEYIPARKRGQALLALGILGSALGFALAAGVATLSHLLLDSMNAWRLMWLFGLVPAAFILVLRSRIIPESARFLIARGRLREARLAAESLVGPIPDSEPSDEPPKTVPVRTPVARLLWKRYLSQTLSLGLFAFSWGIANFGFVIWLPTLMTQLGYTNSQSSSYLALSALLAVPALAVSTWLYTRWSTKGTLVAYALGGGLAIAAMGAALGGALVSAPMLIGLASLTILFLTSLAGAYPIYTAEVFPTEIRSFDSGIVHAIGRIGSLLGPLVGGIWFTMGGSILSFEVALATMLAIAGILLAFTGRETRGMTLEQIERESWRR